MKPVFFLPLALLLFSFTNRKPLDKIFTAVDTTIISHELDGLVNEWPLDRFETDNATKTRYSFDNDPENLYIAMVIPEFATQMKMMRQGMSLFVDVKGKKKETRSIEFPIRSEQNYNPTVQQNSNTFQSTSQQNNETGERNFDKKAIRSRMVMSLIFLKLIGFSDTEPVKQGLQEFGSVNIQFTWDSTDVMLVEYRIPLSLLGEITADQKTISVGWKINGIENNNLPVSSSSKIVTVPAGSRPTVNSRGQSNANSQFSQQERENMMKEQSFWTRYTMK